VHVHLPLNKFSNTSIGGRFQAKIVGNAYLERSSMLITTLVTLVSHEQLLCQTGDYLQALDL
jgi:hypothetical protein